MLVSTCKYWVKNILFCRTSLKYEHDKCEDSSITYPNLKEETKAYRGGVRGKKL